MGRRRVLLAAALAAVGIVVGRRALEGQGRPPRERSQPRPGDSAHGHARGGWATCSAPGARWYEVAADALLGGLYRRLADDLAGAVTAVPAPAVLEVGPGPGNLAVELARRVPDLRLTGLDIDPAMVERAILRARREGLGDRLAFVVGDVATLPFPDASFDLVTSSLSVHHWPDAAAGFAEIRRVLRPGGQAIVYDLRDRWGHVETKALPLAGAAVAGGFEGAAAAPFRWPGRLALVNRLEALKPPVAS
ncbi:MAG TPA: class I SAM-dependent methyltransferase [Patescibacteria group bacterium]|nr:class I SAM-dependent methyltransferase [Patescibacteria group bacterium]